ncbi:sulfur carrier protein ThiS [Limibacter armeniacum]|uniref:sulfur carrier protein ThiS n=1 Tax=Limibacter armeniacum TaxID=466084 RepID=UPI002FE5FD86
MQVTINQDSIQLPANCTVALAVKEKGVPFQGTAVAVNYEVIPQEAWESHALKEGDNITIIRATQGG